MIFPSEPRDKMTESARLLRLAGALRDTSDVEALLNRAAAAFRELALADCGAIFLGDDRTGDLVLRAAASADGALALDEVEGRARQRTLAAIREGRTFSLLNGDQVDEKAVTIGLAGNGAADYLVVGLHDGLRLLGVVYLERPGLDRGGEPLIHLLLLAEQAALALANSRLREEAAAAGARQSEFVSVVNHQLRVPMTAIRGYADLLASGKTGALNERQEEFLHRIRRNVDRMATLASDLAVISGYDTGRLTLELEPFDAVEAVEQVVRALRPRFDARGQRVATVAPAGLPHAFGNGRATAEVLGRLLSNANLYTPEGGSVTVRIRENGWQIMVGVTDDGPGISSADQGRLFTPFFRSEDDWVRQQPGWGLGLAVARHMAEAQGGRITVTSSRGQGSTFTLAIPARVI